MRVRRDLYVRRYVTIVVVACLLIGGLAAAGYFGYRYFSTFEEKESYVAYDDACRVAKFHFLNPLYLFELQPALKDGYQADYGAFLNQLLETEFVTAELKNRRAEFDNGLKDLEKIELVPPALKDIHQPLVENLKTGSRYIDGLSALMVDYDPENFSAADWRTFHGDFQSALETAALYLTQLEKIVASLEGVTEEDLQKLPNCRNSQLTTTQMKTYIKTYKDFLADLPAPEDLVEDDQEEENGQNGNEEADPAENSDTPADENDS